MVHNNSLYTYPSFLFIFSLLLLLLSYSLYYIFSINIPLQYFITLNIFVIFPIYISLKKIKLINYDFPILISLIYFLITLPISTDFNLVETIKSYKDIVPPFVIYFYFRAYITDRSSFYNFGKIIFMAGIITSIYLMFELFMLFSGLGSGYLFGLKDFAEKFHPYLSSIENNLKEATINYYRPNGILLDIHSQAFIIVSSISIYSSLKKYFSYKTTIIYFYILCLLLSTSMQNIGAGFATFFITYLIIEKNKISFFHNHIYKKIFLSIIPIIIALIYFVPLALENFLTHKFGYGDRGTLSVMGIIIEAITGLFSVGFVTLYNQDLVNFLIGQGTSRLDVIGGEAHFIGETLAHIGVIGFFFYFYPFLKALINGMKMIKHFNLNQTIPPIFIFTISISLIIFVSLIHYSPVNHCTIFIMGFCLFTGYTDWSFIKYSRLVNSTSTNMDKINYSTIKPQNTI